VKANQDKPATQGEHPRKWWRRYADGDWRWSDESWQTELSKQPKEKGEK
jgi:hypothetical protein